ncbi:MAG: acetylornithine deacetylase [Gemmatimonadota bacterium]|nr:MAG: acetylornithine deacetylase [Gemmatimonadota bacterium]
MSNAELLSCLVGFDSTSCNSNLPIADFICSYLDRPGVRIQRNPSPDGEKANLVISAGPEECTGIDGLVLSGHMDVVPANEPEWSSDPFALTRVGDTYVGRGACDMKGFLALALNAMTRVRTDDLTAPLVLILTYDEEVGTRGAQHLAKTWDEASALPRQAVIGEPTELKVIRMHKGHLAFTIRLSGESAHSGYPHLGRNAIEPVGQLICGLTRLREELQSEHPANSEHFPEVPFVSLNVAQVAGGSAVNVVPDRCVLKCDTRLLPGADKESIIGRIEAVVADSLADTPCEFELDAEAPPMLLQDTAPIYRALCTEVGQAHSHSVSYATDAGWLQSLGLDCAVFGPGSIAVAHKPNESIPINQLEQADQILQRIVYQFCMMH